MTISTTTNRVSYAGDDSTTAFAVPYAFFDNTDLTVTLVNATTGAETVQTITTEYTVSGGAGSTGTVTMVTAPATGQNLVITRDVPYTQGSDLINNDTQDAEVVEDALDRLTMLAQQLFDTQSRMFRLSDANESASIAGMTDTESGRGGKLLSFSSDGTALGLVDPTDVTAIVTSLNSFQVFRFTATASQTVFTGADDDSNTLDFAEASALVLLNGVLLELTADYTTTTGTTVTLVTGADAGDVLTVIAFGTFEVADHYTKANADSRFFNVDGTEDSIDIEDGVTAPSAEVGKAKIYVDAADGDLKVKFGDGFVAVIAADS